MSRKPHHGTRSPSTRLNDTVNQLSDGEFEDVVAILSVSRKKRKWFELILWHRGKLPYEVAAERAAFDGYDLNSMRELALKRLDEVITILRSGLPADLEEIRHRIENISKEELLLVLSLIQAAKAHATRRCYMGRLLKLVELQMKVVKLAFSGLEQKAALNDCASELRQAQANIELAPKVSYYRVEYWEKVKKIHNESGVLDMQLIHGYLDSDIASLDVSGYPPRLGIEKLILDELFHAIIGDVHLACAFAERVWNLDQEGPYLSLPSRAKLMVRLNEYYIVLRSREKAEQFLAQFCCFEPESPVNRAIYLIPFLVAMLDWAIESGGPISLETALGYFERNQEFVLDSPIGGNRSRILIAIIAIYLGQNRPFQAKALFNHLYRDKDQKPPLYYRITAMLCHLLILFDLGEVAELKRHAKNYREFILEKKSPLTVLALAFISFLQFNARRYASENPSAKVVQAYRKDYAEVIERLKTYEALDSSTNRLLFGTCMKWLQSKEI